MAEVVPEGQRCRARGTPERGNLAWKGEIRLCCALVLTLEIIEKRLFLQGRQSIPRGNHFFPVRIYNEAIEP